MRKNLVVRKLIMLSKQPSRFLKRLNTKNEDYLHYPPVLLNSFPKSGTHLLLQILEVLPGVSNYGSFIASMPSLTFQERSPNTHLRLIDRIVPGELIPAHLFYDDDYCKSLKRKNCIIYFVYRDPRDIAVSEAIYLTDMNEWHRMHTYYSKKLHNLDERISTAILGVQDKDFRYCYPDIAKRFERYRPWLDQSNVLPIRFEDMVSPQLDLVIHEIINLYSVRSSIVIKPDLLLEEAKNNIDPRHSHTYRKGKVGNWREVFSPIHKEQMKRVAGDLLIELGYEKDYDW